MRPRCDETDLESIERFAATMGLRVPMDPSHKQRLRQLLVQRHMELTASGGKDKSRRFLRFSRIKRYAVIGPAALLSAAACMTLIWSLQVAGHRSVPTAQDLTQALAKTVPTVTAWQVTVHQEQSNSAQNVLCPGPLHPGGLYVRNNIVYLWVANRWYQVPANAPNDPRCPPYWQWVYAVLPQQLAHHQVQLSGGQTIGGKRTEQIRYSAQAGLGKIVKTSVWVDQRTGLLLKLQRVTLQGATVVNRVTALYRYQQAKQ